MTTTEEKITVDADRVLELLTTVVKREGRDTVTPCRYVDYDDRGRKFTPLCLIARVLVEVGVPVDVMATFGSKTAWLLWDEGKLNEFVDLSPEAAGILQKAQSMQDAHYPWGRALAGARRHAWRLGVHGKQ